MTISQFARFYAIPRRRVELAVTRALAQNGGRFELPGLGAFQAKKSGEGRTALVQIEMFDVRHGFKTLPPPPTVSEADAASPAPQPPSSENPASDSPEDAAPVELHELSESELKRRLTAARIAAIEQESAVKRAKLRGEVVAYCANSVQILLASFRSELASLHLDAATTDALSVALSDVLSDLDAVSADLIANVPPEQIELAITRRRAERIAARRASELDKTSSVSLISDPENLTNAHAIQTEQTPAVDSTPSTENSAGRTAASED